VTRSKNQQGTRFLARVAMSLNLWTYQQWHHRFLAAAEPMGEKGVPSFLGRVFPKEEQKIDILSSNVIVNENLQK